MQIIASFHIQTERKVCEIMNQKWGFSNLKEIRISKAVNGHKIETERPFERVNIKIDNA